MKKRIGVAALIAATFVWALLQLAPVPGVSADEGDDNRLVEFKGRKIDLKPYIEGFPYGGFQPYYDAGKLFYYHYGETTELRELDLGGDPDLAAGRVVSDIDFSKRNVWTTRFRKNDRNLYWTGDEINDEIINLYRFDPATGAIARLTDVPYIYGWRWDEGRNNVAFVARLGHKEERLGELRVLNLETREEKAIVQDTPEMRFTWGSPSWHPEGKGVVIPAVKNADRAYGNLLYVDLATGEKTLITDPEAKRSWPGAYDEWLSPTEFIYFSNEDGFRNVYKYDVASKSGVQLTTFDRDVGEAELITVGARQVLFIVLSNPIENEIVVVDPSSGETLMQKKVDVNVSILDVEGNRLMASTSSNMSKFRIEELSVTADDVKFATRVDVPKKLRQKILQARAERLEFPTFDVDPNTGEARMLHAFLYHPKNPLPKDEQIVMIQSFYGGGNYFSTRTQILAEAGIYVFSPSPRGSSGFGRKFSALNDKDLGGNEIIDVIYAAKYISERLDIPPERIGVYGGSHGGYATMRLLTFPGEINGNEAHFDWGFGISHAGFSDIIQFYEFCNIPDWVTLEAGDPATEADKLRDRSPLYHADKAVGKLLLTHGTNDSRVPIEGSRAMADSLRKYDKDVRLVEFEGQGHGIKGLENNIRNYNVWFDFLEEVTAKPRSSSL